MKNKRLLHAILAGLLLAALVTVFFLLFYLDDLPNRISQHETLIFGQTRFAPGSQAALRVLVRDSKDGSPLENAQIEVAMHPEGGGPAVTLYSAATGPGGTADVAFRIPPEAQGSQVLTVNTRSRLGSDTVERPVSIERDYRVLLSSDKPIYQPGQVIHLRALALATFDRAPAAGQPLEITIADGKGNKVFRKALQTDDYGVTSVDFQLASEVNSGNYKVTAAMGNTTSEKTVRVEPYVLPKFDLDLKTERAFYQPGQHAAATLNAAYFFGKPVSGGQVKVEGYTFDVQQNQVFSLEGVTGEDGAFAFEFDLPAYLTGSELDQGLGRFYLQVAVTDEAQHTEIKTISLAVSNSPLVIEAVPEGGAFRQGIENILYVMLSYPDGSPVDGALQVTLLSDGQALAAETGPYGMAEVRFTPSSPYQQIQINAEDKLGGSASQTFDFESDWQEDSLLLRPERAVYQVGEAMKLHILSARAGGSAYLDVVRDGQTVSTRAIDLPDGQAEVTIDLTPDLAGTLELHAYRVSTWGSISRDTRLVVVSQAEDLSVHLSAGQDSYLPGDTARVNISVQGSDGQGVQSAIGLAIVDESVFALAEVDPGFARLYFLLEQEILEPHFDLHGYSVADMVRGVPESDPALTGALDRAAKASLAEIVRARQSSGASPFSLSANSHQEAVARANDMRDRLMQPLRIGLFVFYLAIPLAMAILAVAALRRWRVLRRSLLYVLYFFIGLVLFLLLVPSPDSYRWTFDPLEKLGDWLSWLSYGGEWIVLGLALAGLVGFISLVVIAIRRRDGLLGWFLFLLPVCFVVLGLLIAASNHIRRSPPEAALIAGLLALLVLAVTPLIYAAGALAQRLRGRALALFTLPAFLLFGLIPIFMGGGAIGNVMTSTNAVMFDAAVPEAAMLRPMGLAGGMEEKQEAGGVPQMDALPSSGGGGDSQVEAPRLRQYFPETMLWLPDAVTNPDGTLQIETPAADSITTWRMTALASSLDGRLGSASAPLRVFQDFFIDLDLPLSLTVGDEVSIPVGIYNYLPVEQSVRLELKSEAWFELKGEAAQEVLIAANEVSVIYFRIQARQFGMQPFQVTAWGSQMSDAIRKQVRVFPNGKEIHFTHSDRLLPGKPVSQAVQIAPEALAGTQRLSVKIYPGVLSQVVEGLDSILRMPYGCFEQTSSTTYPNVLVMDYLKSTNQAAPEVQMKAEEYINLGYQRLTTFEVGSSGGFSLFGNEPADRMLTAYGLQEFSDMSRVHPVDEALVERAARWLESQQATDGAWENDRGLVHEQTWSSLGDDRLPVTAYITWSLYAAGFGGDEAAQKGLAYVREHQARSEDAYVLALVANALVTADRQEGKISPGTEQVLERLAALAKRDGEGAYWQSGVATFMGSEGQTGSIETTALAALALLRSETQSELANAALLYLVRQKDSFGTWHSTQATVLTLKALLESVRIGAESTNAEVTVTLNGGQAKTLQVTPENFDVVQVVTFDDVPLGLENHVDIFVEGQGTLMYQVAGGYYLAWDQLDRYPDLVPQGEQVDIQVRYDRAELAVNDTVTMTVSLALNEPGAQAESGLIDLGIPPGFSVLSEDLQAQVERFKDVPPDYAFATIERFELTGRQVLVYVSNLQAGQPLEFSFRLRARFPLNVQAPASSAYDYYNPDVTGETPPQQIVVVEP